MKTKKQILESIIEKTVRKVLNEETIKKKLIGKKCKVSSENDNDNYDKFRNKILKVTHASVGGRGYDSGMHPQALMDFVDAKTGEEIPFSLYEYEVDFL